MADQHAANPSVADAFNAVLEEMQAGSAFPLDRDSRHHILSLYRPSFEKRLETPGAWAAEGPAVLNAARQVGVIAGALATLQFQPEPRVVCQWMVDEAAKLVERYCSVGAEEGQWCKRGV